MVIVDEEGTWIKYQNHLRFFKENSSADSLTINPVYPSANREVNVVSVQTIKWISEVPVGETSLVKLELSINDTIGPWHLIADELPNNGHHQWSVPENMASYQKCRFRYTVYTQIDSVVTITPEGFYIIGIPVISEDIQNEVPEEFNLHQNYPNPFNPNTKIKFTLTPSLSLGERVSEGRVRASLKVYDVLGNEIATLVNEELPAGEYEVEFSGHSDEGQNLASGVYFYQLIVRGPVREDSFGETNSGQAMIQTKKMVLLR